MNGTDESPIAHCRDRRRLGRLISEIERTGITPALPGPAPPTSATVGITGPAGAGKSTLVGALVTRIRESASSVAALLVDPSSPVNGGALLGDRIRIGAAAGDRDIFIRSMGTRGAYGGVASAVPGAIQVLQAAGFDWIVIETVGIGQTDVAVSEIVDTTVLVQTPESGDGIQSEKAGVLEIADVLVVNKADREGAPTMANHLRERVQRSPRHDGWSVPVITTHARANLGIDDLWSAVTAHREHLKAGSPVGR